MQPRNHLLNTYRSLTSRGITSINAILDPNKGFTYEDSRPKPIQQSASDWKLARKDLAAIDQAILELGEGVYEINANTDLTQEAQQTRARILGASVSTKVDALRSNVTTRADSIVSRLHAASYPARPLPNDATQEAALAGIKADLQLALSSASDGPPLLDRMITHLGRAIGDKDELATWVLASSRWPEDYLVSRHCEYLLEAWQALVASALDDAMPANLAKVRDAYNGIIDPKNGINVITVSLVNLLPQVIAELSAWSLTTPKTPAERGLYDEVV